MTRVLSRLVTMLSLLVLVTIVHGAEPRYTVVLTDGSFVRAAERPVVVGEIAWIQLPNGMRANMDPARIDWKRSDAISSQADVLFAKAKETTEETALPQPVKKVEGTITMTSTPEQTEPDGESTTSTPPEPTVDELDPEIQDQVKDIDSLIRNKLYEKKKLEDEVEQKKYNLDVVKQLRQKIADIDTEIRLAQQQRRQLVGDE